MNLPLFLRVKPQRIYLLFWMLVVVLQANCSKDQSPSNPSGTTPETPETVDPAEPTTNTSPNILFVIADDLGIDAMPGYAVGAQKPNMPTLERLANSGIRFTQAWASPVCTPTRASLLTGKYGFRTGVLGVEQSNDLPANERIVQRAMEGRYSTSVIGKWHVTTNNQYDRPEAMGVGHYAGLFTGGVNDYSNWLLTTDGSAIRQDTYMTTALTDLAIDWIAGQDQPWFCWLAYFAPHSPFHLPPQALHTQGVLPEDEASIAANPLPYYFAMIESVDSELGRLLSSLSSSTLENTLIVFIGDNGTPNQVAQAPYAATKAKGSLYEGGIRVPLVVSGYGVSRQGVEDQTLVSAVDLYNTFLEVGGFPTEELDSQSLWPLIHQNGDHERSFNYSEVLGNRANRSGYTLWDGRFKLIVLNNGNELFFDLQNDPSEDTNLLATSLSAEAQSALSTLRVEAQRIRS